MYLLYRYRHPTSWLLTLMAAVCLLFSFQKTVPSISPHYDDAVTELTLVELEPEPQPEPPPVEPEPEPEPMPPEPEPEPLPAETAPVIQAKPVPKPAKIKPKAKPKETLPPVRPTPTATPVEKPVTEAPRPAQPPAPPAPRVSAQAIENGYLVALRHDLEQYKRYPSGRQASLERPQGNVDIWVEIDRNGRVLDSGIANKASSMLLNRAATSTLQSITQVKPFPSDAFAGQSSKRFTATFNYQAP